MSQSVHSRAQTWTQRYFIGNLSWYIRRVLKRDRSRPTNLLGSAAAVCVDQNSHISEHHHRQQREQRSELCITNDVYKNPHYKLVRKAPTACLNVQQIRQNECHNIYSLAWRSSLFRSHYLQIFSKPHHLVLSPCTEWSQNETTMFDCSHLHNAWTCLSFSLKHICSLYIDQINKTKWCHLPVNSTTRFSLKKSSEALNCPHL